jgi:hypothetical protein
MSKTNFIVSLVVVAGIAFAVGYIVGGSMKDDGGEPTVTAEQAAKLPTVAKGIEMCPSLGPEGAKVTVLEFSEFQ